MSVRRPRACLHALVLGALLAHACLGHAAQPVPCTTAMSGHDRARLVCPLPESAASQALDLRISFSGVHDDSEAAVGLRLDGQVLDCSAGRTRLRGDAQGDTLQCELRLAPATSPRSLQLDITWYHAQPASFSLERR